METCEQRRAREYGIDPAPAPRDAADPTHWNAVTIERQSPVAQLERALSHGVRVTR